MQYYSLNGSASNYIPIGPILPILKGDINDSKILVGGALNETTDKAASITIPYINASSGLNYARVVRIHYTILGEVPSISVVYDGPVSTTIDTIVTDTGQFIESVSPEEYALIINPFKCKTIEQKNNILFAGNILQSEFDINYDARIRRYNYDSIGAATIPSIYEVSYNVEYAGEYPVEGFNTTIDINVVVGGTPTTLTSTFISSAFQYIPQDFKSGFDGLTTGIQCSLISENLGLNTGTFVVRFTLNSSDFTLNSSSIFNSTPTGLSIYTNSISKIQTYTPGGTDSSSVYSGDYNPYNDPTKTTFTDSEKYIYKSDGETIGGTGVNGSYSFGKYESPIFDNGNFKPIHSTNIYHKNFTRGEIYAFALVGFDEYMRPAFAKYIDDIKIPDLSESHLTFSDPITPMNRYDSGTNKYYGAGIYPIFQYANIPTDIKYVCVVRTSR